MHFVTDSYDAILSALEFHTKPNEIPVPAVELLTHFRELNKHNCNSSEFLPNTFNATENESTDAIITK